MGVGAGAAAPLPPDAPAEVVATEARADPWPAYVAAQERGLKDMAEAAVASLAAAREAALVSVAVTARHAGVSEHPT